MNTRTALAHFSGIHRDITLPPEMAKKFGGVVASEQAGIRERQAAPVRDMAHLTALTRTVKEALAKATLDPDVPVIDRYTALGMVREASRQSPSDNGLKRLAQHMRIRWEAEPLGSITAREIYDTQQLIAREAGMRTMAHEMLRDVLPRSGYATMPVRRLAGLAAQIETQQDFDRVVREAGLEGSRPESVRARAFLLALVNKTAQEAPPGEGIDAPMDAAPAAPMGDSPGDGFEPMAAKEEGIGGADMDPKVNQSQGESMTGPKAGDGGAALSADSMGKQIQAGIRHLIAGNVLQRGNYRVFIDPKNAQVVLQARTGAKRVAGMASIDRVVADLFHLTADVMEPKVNQTQGPSVNISEAEGGSLLGRDSQTDTGSTDAIVPSGAPKQQHPAQAQAGTSSGVDPGAEVKVKAAYLCRNDKCGHRMVAQAAMPKWVAQPEIWHRMARAAAVNGHRHAPYPQTVHGYRNFCNRMQLRAARKNATPEVFSCPKCRQATLIVLADGTLGPDHQQDEPSWGNPHNSGAHNSKPSMQPGTSLADPGAAEEPDRQQDEPSWVDPGTIETSRLGPTAGRRAQLDNFGGEQAPSFGKEEQIENLGDDKQPPFDAEDAGDARNANIDNFGDKKAPPFTDKDAEEARKKKDGKGGWLGKKAIHDTTPVDPREAYTAALNNRPSKALLEGIGSDNDWLTRRAGARIAELMAPSGENKTPSSRRADLEQQGSPRHASMAGQFEYDFTFNPSQGQPTFGQVQAFISEHTRGSRFRVLRAAAVDRNVLRVVLAEEAPGQPLLTPPEPGDDLESKAASIRAAMSGRRASALAHFGVTAQDHGNDGGEGMASDYGGTVLNHEGQAEPPGVAPGCAQHAQQSDPSCPMCLANAPADDGMGMGVEGQGMGVPGIPSAPTDNSGGEVNAQEDKPSCPKCGNHDVEHYGPEGEFQCTGCSAVFNKQASFQARLARQNAPWVNAALHLQVQGHGVGHEPIAKWADRHAITYVSAAQMAACFAEAHKLAFDYKIAAAREASGNPRPKGRSAAKIHEGWGEGGNFERQVEADSPGDLWKIHQGLNGGEPPIWPEAPVAQPAQSPVAPPPAASTGAGSPATGGAPPGGKDGQGPVAPPGQMPMPKEPPPGDQGQAKLPEPEPGTLEGQREEEGMVPEEVRQAMRRGAGFDVTAGVCPHCKVTHRSTTKCPYAGKGQGGGQQSPASPPATPTPKPPQESPKPPSSVGASEVASSEGIKSALTGVYGIVKPDELADLVSSAAKDGFVAAGPDGLIKKLHKFTSDPSRVLYTLVDKGILKRSPAGLYTAGDGNALPMEERSVQTKPESGAHMKPGTPENNVFTKMKSRQPLSPQEAAVFWGNKDLQDEIQDMQGAAAMAGKPLKLPPRPAA